MSRRGDNIEKKIVSISEDCSGTRCEENENELSQNENKIEILKSNGSGRTQESSEKENFQNFYYSRKRMILSDSESENDKHSQIIPKFGCSL